MKIGNDLDHAVEFNMALGPAGEVLRLWEDRIDEIRPKIAAELREALAEFEGPDGVFAPASTWIIGATAPAARPVRPSSLRRMADAASTESVAPRLAAVREQLTLLSDYL